MPCKAITYYFVNEKSASRRKQYATFTIYWFYNDDNFSSFYKLKNIFPCSPSAACLFCVNGKAALTESSPSHRPDNQPTSTSMQILDEGRYVNICWLSFWLFCFSCEDVFWLDVVVVVVFTVFTCIYLLEF